MTHAAKGVLPLKRTYSIDRALVTSSVNKKAYFVLSGREVLNFPPAHDSRVPSDQARAELWMSWKRWGYRDLVPLVSVH